MVHCVARTKAKTKLITIFRTRYQKIRKLEICQSEMTYFLLPIRVQVLSHNCRENGTSRRNHLYIHGYTPQENLFLWSFREINCISFAVAYIFPVFKQHHGSFLKTCSARDLEQVRRILYRKNRNTCYQCAKIVFFVVVDLIFVFF